MSVVVDDETFDILEKEKTRCGCKKIQVYRILTYYNIWSDFCVFASSVYFLVNSKQYFIDTNGSKKGEKLWKYTLTINYILIP